MNRPPYEKSPRWPGCSRRRAVALGVGFDLQDCPMTGGGSDGNFTAALGVPTLDGLGIDGDGAHTLERIRADLVDRAAPALIKGLLETV
jgi:glutamate carboxypeptidase